MPLKTYVTRLPSAFRCAFRGLGLAFKNERAFASEFIIAIVALVVLYFLQLERIYKLWMISSIGLVLIVELLNSAIEKTVDRISVEIHPLSGYIKDISAAAVLLSMMHACVVWCFILFLR